MSFEKKTEFAPGMTIAKITKGGLHFEVLVNVEDALKFRKKDSDFLTVEGDRIFTNIKKGDVASQDDLEVSFGTKDVIAVGKEIVRKGDLLLDQEHRDEEKDKRIKQVVDFLATNSMDPQTGHPHSPERIRNAMEQAHVNVKNAPIDSQMPEILKQLSTIIPIKIETKKVKIIVPAIHTGRAYGLIATYKEKEDWLSNGDLSVVVAVPAGLIMDFYDKLNGITHGSALTEEIRED